MSGGPTSARSERQAPSQVDVEDRGPGGEPPGEIAWSPTPVLKRPRGRRDRTGTLVAITLVAVAVAAIKPWGAAAPGPTVPAVAGPTAAVATGPTAPQPTAGPVISDRNAMACLTHQVEQVLTLERWPDREVKSWSQASGGVVTISSSHVVGIGVCPGIGPAATDPGNADALRDPLVWAGAALTDVRRLDGPKVLDLGRPPRITEQTDYVAAGVLYGPPPTDVVTRSAAQSAPPGPAWQQLAGRTLSAWPSGRYEIRYVFPGDPDATIRSVVLEIAKPLNDG